MKYIMILEDDKELAEGMSLALAGEDFSFSLCETIEEAEKQWQERDFDLLLLDVNLPDGSGFDFCRRSVRKARLLLSSLRPGIWSWTLCGDWSAEEMITSPSLSASPY